MLTEIIQSYVELGTKRQLSPTDSTALAEVLKFLYNLTFHIKVRDDVVSPYILVIPESRLVGPLIQLLLSYLVKEFRLPLTNIVHALLNLPLPPSQSDLFPCDSPTRVVQYITDTIDRTIPQDTDTIDDTSIDENLSPVFALLSSIYETAPTTVKTFMKEQLLPTETYFLWNY
jgi:hypothetical protein